MLGVLLGTNVNAAAVRFEVLSLERAGVTDAQRCLLAVPGGSLVCTP